jgi:hypothetical protein
VVPLLLIPVLLSSQTLIAEARGVHAPRHGAYAGAWVKPSDWSMSGWKRAVTGLQSRIGHRLDIVHYYYQWRGWFPSDRERWEVRHHQIPLISWQGTNTDAIRRGSYDSLIRARADAVRRFHKPMFIRWNWEMDRGGPTIPSPASYVGAWRRIVSIFRNRGATNASFVWCPTAYSFTNGLAQRYWPGRKYVDWTCADGYNWYPGRKGTSWTSFRQVFHSFYAWGKDRHRPMMVGEFGVQEDRRHSGRKAEWITQAKRTLRHEYRKIKAVVYFNANRIYDWRLTSSASATRAFGRLAASRYFN